MPIEAHTRSGVLRQNAAAFARILRENGWITEADLASAEQHAARKQLDLVEAVVALRLVDEHDSSILVLTSEDGPDIERRVLQLGADDDIVKPFDPEMLVSRVIAAVHRAPADEAAAANGRNVQVHGND